MLGKFLPALCAFAIGLAGCANISTIGRRTALPSPSGQEHGKAIHLDAEQRLVFANAMGRVCAEPSPDALTSFAAALGAGGSLPNTGSAAVSGALTEAAGSIGLRTQSISLLRDALYRICEAYYNDQLSKPQVMLLLSRSQDLTASIVAIEQLTGAVVAHQVGLGGASSGSSTAILVANAKLLEQLRQQKLENEQALAKAQQDLKAAEAVRDTTVGAIANLKSQKASTPANDAADHQRLDGEIAANEATLKTNESAVKTAQQQVEIRKANLETTTSTIKTVETSLDSASAAATASASSNVSFTQSASTVRLNDSSTENIAEAVKTIVSGVIAKNYIVESCIAHLTNPPNPYPKGLSEAQINQYQQSLFDLTRGCVAILSQRSQAEAQDVQKRLEQLK